MSDQLTSRWKDASETMVISKMGPYKSKVEQGEGYVIRFDYSYAHVEAVKSKSPIQVKAAFSSSINSLTPRNNDMNTGPRSAEDSVIKFIDFYFNKLQRVHSVYAAGYPDSVYYVKRRG